MDGEVHEWCTIALTSTCHVVYALLRVPLHSLSSPCRSTRCVLRGLPHLQVPDSPPLFEWASWRERWREPRFGNLLTLARHPVVVGLHHITWRATASAVSNMEVLAEAMAWLIGDDEDVELDRSRSYHGPELTLIKASTANKRRAARSFARLGEANLRQLIDEFEQRVDEHNVLHFRLSMDSLIQGKPTLVNATETGTVKGQAKFEVYAGLPADEQLQATFDEALEIAARYSA